MDVSKTLGSVYKSSASSGTFSSFSTFEVDVTNLTLTITSSGRPLIICCVPENASTSSSYISVTNSSGGSASGFVYLYKNGSTYSNVNFNSNITSISTTDLKLPPHAICFFDTPSAGSNTYKLRANVNSTNTTITLTRVILIAYEL